MKSCSDRPVERPVPSFSSGHFSLPKLLFQLLGIGDRRPALEALAYVGDEPVVSLALGQHARQVAGGCGYGHGHAAGRIAGGTAGLPVGQGRALTAQHNGLGRIQVFFNGEQQGAMGRRQSLDGRPGGLEGALYGFQVTRLPQQMSQAPQGVGRDAVAGGYRLIGQGLGTVDEPFVVPCRE